MGAESSHDAFDEPGGTHRMHAIDREPRNEIRVESTAFADRLNTLFVSVRVDGVLLTNVGLSRILAAQGTICSQPYISQLRNGRRNNPSVALCVSIAKVFGVPSNYFFERSTGATFGCVDGAEYSPRAALSQMAGSTVLVELLLNASCLETPAQRLLLNVAKKFLQVDRNSGQ